MRCFLDVPTRADRRARGATHATDTPKPLRHGQRDVRVLVTGAAGFIGNHVAERLIHDGHDVTGVDNLEPYYDVALKEARVDRLHGWTFIEEDLADKEATAALMSQQFDAVIHLAAQAGVRHSLSHPHAYTRNNVEATLNVLEGCRYRTPTHLLYASSSSVYGLNAVTPWSVHDGADHPMSLYAATKKCCEGMAHAYSHLYGIPATGLRFFSVYGPWGRPDMALWLFADAIFEGRPIDVYNHGDMIRDWTYVDDVVEGIVRLIDKPPAPNPQWDAMEPDPATSSAPHRILNIGNDQPTRLGDFIDAIESNLGRSAQRNLLPMQPGDVAKGHADVEDLWDLVGFRPRTSVEEGIGRFIEWFKEYKGAS